MTTFPKHRRYRQRDTFTFITYTPQRRVIDAKVTYEDLDELAVAYLTDPRDDIERITVWDNRPGYEQIVWVYYR